MRWILLVIFSIGMLLFLPELAFADNCSTPADCWGTAAGGAATAGGIGGGFLMWLWKEHKHRQYMRRRYIHYTTTQEPHEHITEPSLWMKERLTPEEFEEYWQLSDQLRRTFDAQREGRKHDVDYMMKLYKMYQKLATAIGGEEKKSSIAASGKA